MWFAALTISLVFCAIMAIRAKQLLSSILWLAGASAVLALFLYSIGAHELAVIELSVGAGLVTILVIFVLNLVGETPTQDYSGTYRWFSVVSILVAVGALAMLVLSGLASSPEVSLTSPFSFATVVWKQRTLDTMLQLLLIFSGSLGVLSLVVVNTPAKRSDTNQVETAQTLPTESDAVVPGTTDAGDQSKEEQVYHDPVTV